MRVNDFGRKQKIFHVGAIICLFAALLAGRFSFDRFFSNTFVGMSWLQLRLWFTLFATICSLMAGDLWRSFRLRSVYLYWIPFLILQAYLVINLIVLGSENGVFPHLLDLFFIVFSSILIIFIFRSKEDLRIFAVAAEIVGLILFLFCLVGFGDPAKWAPFGSVITFYHIEFLTFCCGFYLAYAAKDLKSFFTHGIIGSIGLFSALATSSKAAVVGALVIAAYVSFWSLSTKEYRKSAFVIVMMMATFISFGVLRLAYVGERFSVLSNSSAVGEVISQASGGARINENIQGGFNRGAAGGRVEGRLPFPYDVLKEMYSGRQVEFDDLDGERQAIIKSFWEITKSVAPDYRTNLKGFLEFTTTRILMQDGTARLQMALVAWDIFKQHRWLGIGLGNYRDFGINTYDGVIEEYRHPHNIVLEMLATTGLIGAGLFGVVIFIFAVLFQQKIFEDTSLMFLMAYFLVCFVTALFSGDYYDFRLFWYIALISLVSLPSVGNRMSEKQF